MRVMEQQGKRVTAGTDATDFGHDRRVRPFVHDDHIRIGNGCTLGPAAFIHYGVTMGDGSIADLDSFVMKGEVLEPNSVWRGNPAKLLRFVRPVKAA